MRLQLLVAGLFLVLTPNLASAQSGVDRYGGVWNEGVATGPFVPLAAGMSFNDLLAYQQAWSEFRITDFELSSQGCPADEVDRFASQWEKGEWRDELVRYSSRERFEMDLVNKCKKGMVAVDFEIWRTRCRRTTTEYVVLYNEGKCSTKVPPMLISGDPSTYDNLVGHGNFLGLELVDFELDDDFAPTEVLGIFYPGKASQDFAILDRPDFESQMLATEGVTRLMDMESFQIPSKLAKKTPPIRYVAGLWTNAGTARDDHEVGEVYTKFQQLLFKDQYDRRLVDFEVYPDTVDERFRQVFEKHLAATSAGYAFSVYQSGEEVASHGAGHAVRGVSPVLMTPDSQGVIASVTKLVTAPGVIRFADTQLGDWLDTSIADLLPNDFIDLGAGVDTVTVRMLLTQQTGLVQFTGTSNAVTNPGGYRDELVDWLQQPLMNGGTARPALYQNAHFDLLALVMDEQVLPPVVLSPEPWADWINTEILANANIGTRFCGGLPGDALSYPLAYSTAGIQWMSSGYPCAGYGTGAAMFWLSARDMAKLGDALRDGSLVSAARQTELFDIGMGLDKPNGTINYLGSSDGNSATRGDKIHSKNGGIGGWVGSELTGSETLLAFYDDFNFDDDCDCGSLTICGCTTSTDGPENDEYSYELGYRDFTLGIAIHSSPFDSADPCISDDSCSPTRLFPAPMTILREAIQAPEAW